MDVGNKFLSRTSYVSKPWASSTFLRILAVLSNAAFCKSSSVAVTPIVFKCFPRFFVTVPNAPTTIGTTDVFMLYSFALSLLRS